MGPSSRRPDSSWILGKPGGSGGEQQCTGTGGGQGEVGEEGYNEGRGEGEEH